MLSDAHESDRIMCFSDGAVENWICSDGELSRFGSIQGIHVLDIQYKFLILEALGSIRRELEPSHQCMVEDSGVDFWHRFGQKSRYAMSLV